MTVKDVHNGDGSAPEGPRKSWKEFVRLAGVTTWLAILLLVGIFFTDPFYYSRYCWRQIKLWGGWCSPTVKIVLPWGFSQEQKDKGRRIVDAAGELRLDHGQPDQPSRTGDKVPLEASRIKHFDSEGKNSAEKLRDELLKRNFLKTSIELSPPDRSALFPDPICKGDIEFWMSSQE
jgi:hypothetical protein